MNGFPSPYQPGQAPTQAPYSDPRLAYQPSGAPSTDPPGSQFPYPPQGMIYELVQAFRRSLAEPPLNELNNQSGEQCSQEWLVGAFDSRPMLDLMRARNLWRITVLASPGIKLKIVYGTSATRTVENLRAPLRASVPGQCAIYAMPIDPAHDETLSCVVTATPATSGGLIEMHRPVTGPVAFDDDAFAYLALTASVVNVGAIATAVPALGRVPLIAGSSLASGDGLLEFDT